MTSVCAVRRELSKRSFLLLTLLFSTWGLSPAEASQHAAVPSFPPHLVGNASSVSALLERILPGSSAHFNLVIAPIREGTDANSFTISDTADGKIEIEGTTASELSAAVGIYLREHCGMTFGWVRGILPAASCLLLLLVPD